MKYFIKQSSMFIVVSLLLCLINLSYQENTYTLLENVKTAKTLKNEIKTDLKAKTEIKSNLQTASKTEIKSETSAKSEAKGKSEISTMTDLFATSKTVTEAGGFRVPKGYVMIRGEKNLCIKTARGKQIKQAACNGKNEVLWRFIKTKKAGTYIIQNKNKFVIDNFAFNKNNAGPIYAWTRNNGGNQMWTMINLGKGKFEIKGNHSGKCLDGRNPKIGVKYVQWTCNSRKKTQHFSIVNKTKSRRSTLPSGWVQIKGRGNLCIHAASKKRVTQGPCNSKDNSLWRFIRMGSDYVIQNKNGEVLDSKFKKNNGAHIYAWTRINSSGQKWRYVKLGKGNFELKSVLSNRCLDNTGKSKSGVGYHQWNCDNSNKNQHFRIVQPKRITKKAKRSTKKNKRKNSKKNSRKNKKISMKMRRLIKKNNKPAKKINAPSGWGMIKGNGNLCIHVVKHKRITQGACNNKSNTMWRFIRMGKVYIIQNKNGQVFDVYAGQKQNGAHIKAWDRTNKINQKWNYVNLGRGSFQLKSINSGKCLDNTGKSKLGEKYHQWSCSRNNKNQHFRFIRTSKAKPKRISKKRSSKRGSKKGSKKGKSLRKSSRKGSKKGKSPRKSSRKGSKKGSKRGSKKGLKKGSKRGSKKGSKRGLKKGSKRGSKKGSKRGLKKDSKKGSSKRKGSRKGSSKRKGSKKGSSVKRAANRAARKAARKENKKNGKGKKTNLGYKNRKNIKFLGGKYRFNLVTGKEFCTKKCSPNKSAPPKKCFKGTVQTCNSCVFNGNKSNTLGKESDDLCKTMCNSIDKEKTCEFYTFIDDKKKVINKRLLNRFGRIFIKKYIKGR